VILPSPAAGQPSGRREGTRPTTATVLAALLVALALPASALAGASAVRDEPVASATLIRLSVRPATATAFEQTRFAFVASRLRSGHRRPVGSAVVRFAGARANRSSRASGDRSPVRRVRRVSGAGVQGPSGMRRCAGDRAPARRRSLQ
jgi:hypothetical protein